MGLLISRIELDVLLRADLMQGGHSHLDSVEQLPWAFSSCRGGPYLAYVLTLQVLTPSVLDIRVDFPGGTFILHEQRRIFPQARFDIRQL
jgi:hypothetical protein